MKKASSRTDESLGWCLVFLSPIQQNKGRKLEDPLKVGHQHQTCIWKIWPAIS